MMNCFLKFGYLFTACFLFPISLSSQPFIPAEDAAEFYDIPDNFKAQIDRSIPKETAAVPLKSRKLLIFSQYLKMSVHASVPYANYAFYQMGKVTGAFQTYFSNDTTVFSPEYLSQFDALILNNTTGVLFDDPNTRQYLLDYVYQGKGIIGIHAGAGATFVKYPVYNQFLEFGKMMGGYENGGHPWKTWEWINFQVDDPEHPVTIDIPGSFDISDEIYQYLNEYSRDRVRILLSINTEKTDMENRNILAERLLDDDFPVSWVKSYGRGRVFSSALGHHPHINWDMRVLSHFFRGIQFALGDLEAPTTPTGKLTAETLAQEKTGLNLGISAYTYKNQTFFDVIDHASDMKVWNIGGLNVQKVSSEINKNFDHHLSKDELINIRNKLIESGVSLLTYYIHDIPKDEAECRKLFEFGKFMGIRTFISEPKPGALEFIDEFCNKYNINVAIHNHGPDLSTDYYDPDRLLKVIKNRSEMIGACGDTGYWARNGIDPINAIETLGNRLLTIQLHDLNEKSPEGHDVPWGTGTSDIETILEILSSDSKTLTMIGLEYSYNWDHSNKEIEQSIDAFNNINIDIASNRVK